jgi:chemotaxis protein methyltransferase WspC
VEHEHIIQREIEALLRQKIGLNPDSIGSRSILRAVKKGMRTGKMQGLSDYLQGLKSSPALFESLVESIVVPETSFFRNRASFVFLRQWIAQEWLGKPSERPFEKLSGKPSGKLSGKPPESPKRPLRILSIPCSTGEEPYSVAIALLEEGLSLDDFHIDAVDISALAIATAKAGVYSPYAFRRQTYRSDDKYFALGVHEGATSKRSAQRYVLAESVRQKIAFSQGNILEPEFLAKRQPYDIVFCRNLLIYFDQEARDRTTAFLHRMLRPNGLLFVGYAETGLIDSTLYRSVPYPQTFAFRKRSPDELAHTQAIDSDKQAAPQSWQLPLEPKIIPLSDSSLLSARQFADKGELTKAVELCDRYLLHCPADAQAHLLRGELYQATDDYTAATACFEKAIYLDPQLSEALTHLMLIKEAMGDFKAVSVIRDRLQRLNHA